MRSPVMTLRLPLRPHWTPAFGVALKPARRVEVLGEMAGRRRVWTLEQKVALVAEVEPCDNIAAFARERAVSTALLYTWRREMRYAVESAKSHRVASLCSCRWLTTHPVRYRAKALSRLRLAAPLCGSDRRHGPIWWSPSFKRYRHEASIVVDDRDRAWRMCDGGDAAGGFAQSRRADRRSTLSA